MPDREKVIDFLQHISLYAYEYSDANYEILGYPYLEAERIADDALALLKEQEELLYKKQKDIDRLCNEISEWKHKLHDKSLKEQEETELCDRCGRRRLKSNREGR